MPFLKWKYLPLRRAHCVHGLCLSWNISTQIPTPTIKPEYTCQKYKCQREGVKLRSRADKSLRTGLQHQATKREVGLRSPGAQGRRRPHQVLKMPPVRIRRATVSTHTKGGWSQRQHAKTVPIPHSTLHGLRNRRSPLDGESEIGLRSQLCCSVGAARSEPVAAGPLVSFSLQPQLAEVRVCLTGSQGGVNDTV